MSTIVSNYLYLFDERLVFFLAMIEDQNQNRAFVIV